MQPFVIGQLFSNSRWLPISLFLVAIGGPSVTLAQQTTDDAAKEVAAKKPTPSDGERWKSLLGKWQACEFGGDGAVEIREKLIEVGYGDPLTGVKWTGEFPKDEFEVEVEARRTDGFDFFCALTFPVAKSHCTFVLGGWGGGVMGLSNIDGYDASDNDTTQFRNFEDNKWYRVRVRVDSQAIKCWIDDKEVIEQSREGHDFDIRYEMDPCVPLGLAAFQCDAEYRNARWRPLKSTKNPSKEKKPQAK